MTVTVYTAPQTRGLTTEWFVKEFNIPHEFKVLDRTDGPDGRKSDWYLKINPFGLLPAIKDGDVTMYESGAILLYLQNKYVGALDSEALGRIAQWIQVCNTTVEQAMIAKDVERLERYLGVIDKELTGKEFIVGDSFSAADVMLGGLLSWLQVTMPEVNLEEKFPEVYRYAMDQMEREHHPFRGNPALEEKRKARAQS